MTATGGGLRARLAQRGARFYAVVIIVAAVMLAGAGVGSYAVAQGFAVRAGSWTDLKPAGELPDTIPNATAYDGKAGIALFFYSGFPQSRIDTWGYDAATNAFTELTPSASGPQLTEYSVAYDESAGKVVCFGYPMFAETRETWVYDVGTRAWTKLSPAVSPPIVRVTAMAFDRALGRVVLYGWLPEDSRASGETWAYDAKAETWVDLKPAVAPSRRFDAGMVFDDTSGHLLLFGGGLANGAADNSRAADLWAYDVGGNTWKELTPLVSPPGRMGAMMAFDRASGKTILYGGYGYDNVFGDTWAYDGASNTWTQLDPSGKPGMLADSAMFFSTALGKVVVSGGGNFDEFRPGAWSFTD